MLTPCDHPAYADGKCQKFPNGWHHFSHSHHNQITGFPVDVADGMYWYCGNAYHQWSLQSVSRTHRWSNYQDYGGFTMCVTKDNLTHGSARKVLSNWRGYNFFKVKVQGEMTAQNIRNACRANHLQIPCDHWHYNDGNCVNMRIGPIHMSYPPHNRIVGFPVDVADHVFWYTGPHGHGALENVNGSHRWADINRDYGGDTMCVQAVPRSDGDARKAYDNYRGFDLFKVRVDGRMKNQENLKRACAKNGMKPVCDHPAYYDGHCIKLFPHWLHISYRPHNSHTGFPWNVADNTFFYTGPHGHHSLKAEGGSHRWANDQDYSGDVMCAKASDVRW